MRKERTIKLSDMEIKLLKDIWAFDGCPPNCPKEAGCAQYNRNTGELGDFCENLTEQIDSDTLLHKGKLTLEKNDAEILMFLCSHYINTKEKYAKVAREFIPRLQKYMPKVK